MDYNYFNTLSRRQRKLMKPASVLNNLFNKLKLGIEIVPRSDDDADMITNEQRINLYHLVLRTLHENIEGDVVEFGCHTGNSAMQMEHMLESYQSEKKLHLYDKFNADIKRFNEIKDKLIKNFTDNNLQLPLIHEGWFEETVPVNLPDKISFAHIDCGSGAPVDLHKKVILHLLEHIYPRMSAHSVCLLMDYHVTGKTVRGTNSNPGVRLACDEFLKDKPESVYLLYGNHFSHGYFVKGK